MIQVRLIQSLELVVAVSMAAFPAAPARSAPPPVEAFASLPDLASPALSPDGNRMVALRAVSGIQHAFVIDLTSGRTNPVLVCAVGGSYGRWWRHWRKPASRIAT